MYGWIDLDEFSTINIRKSTTNGAFMGEIIPKKLPSLASAKQAPPGRSSHRCWPQRKGSWPRHAGDRNAKAWQGIFRPIFSTNRFVSNIVQYGNMVVSSKGDTPKSSILVRFSTINQPFCPPHLWNPQYWIDDTFHDLGSAQVRQGARSHSPAHKTIWTLHQW